VAVTYNPIIEVREPPRILFSMRGLQPKPHTVLVLVSASGERMTIRPGQPVPWARTGAYREAYFIDIADHRLQMECHLPSRDGTFRFSAHVSYRCRVEDPALVAENRYTDAAAVIEPVLKRILREVTRHHDPDQADAAEDMAHDELSGKLPSVSGFHVSDCAVRLSLDDDEISYERRPRNAAHRRELDKDELAAIRPLVEAGDDGLLALYLARHPDDAAAVIDLMRIYDRASGEQRLEAFRIMFGMPEADDDFDMERVRHSIASTIAEELPRGAGDS
jgi:hypothetical protein